MTVTQDLHTAQDAREAVVSWLRQNLPGRWVEAVESGDDAAVASMRRELDYAEWCVRMGEAGWATPTWPREYGGAGLSADQARAVNEELNRYAVPRTFNLIALGMAGPVIMQWGGDTLSRRYLPPMAQGREIWCQLFSEPGAGSDVAGLSTRAERDGEEWVVNGEKVWTTLAHISSFGLLLARSNPDVPKHKGLSYFIVDMKAPGVETRPLRQMTGDAEFNEVFFTDVRIPDDHRLGPVGEGWAVATTTLMNERVALSGAGSIAGDATGGGAVDDLIVLAKELGAWEDPLVRQRLARVLSEQRIIKVTNFRAAEARRAGKAPGPEGSITKLFAAEHNKRIQEIAVDMLGARACAWAEEDSLAASRTRMFLRSRANSIEGGTSEIMRNILGERVLGLPKEPSVDRDVPWKDVLRSS